MPQLNFAIPATLLDRIDAAKPEFLSRAGFLSLLISEALDRGTRLPAYCVGAGTRDSELVPRMQDDQTQQAAEPAAAAGACLQEEKIFEPKKRLLRAKKTNDFFATRVISEDQVPAELADCSALLIEFWSVKKGTRSEGVWNRVCRKLLGWTPAQRREALERSIAAGWGDVFDPPAPRFASANQAPEPSRHPAAREFRNGRFVDDEPAADGVLQELF